MSECPKCKEFLQKAKEENLPKVVCSLCAKLYKKQNDGSWELVDDWDQDGNTNE